MNNAKLISKGKKLWELLNSTKILFLIHNYIPGSRSFESGFPMDGFIASSPKIPTIYTKGGRLYFHSDEELVYWAQNRNGEFEISNLHSNREKIEFLHDIKFLNELSAKDLTKHLSIFVSEQQVRESFLKEKFEKALDFALSGRSGHLARYAGK